MAAVWPPNDPQFCRAMLLAYYAAVYLTSH